MSATEDSRTTAAEVKPWLQPREVSDVLLAFPAGAEFRKLLPPRDLAERELAARDDKGAPWMTFQGRWWAGLLPADTVFKAREGVDARLAMRHLSAIVGSYDPKHEHKEAAVAWLASLWLEAPPGHGLASGDLRRVGEASA